MRAELLNNEACALINQGSYDEAIAILHNAVLFGTCAGRGTDDERLLTYPQRCCHAGKQPHQQHQFHYYPTDTCDEGMTSFAQPLLICEVCPDHDEYHTAAKKATIFFNLGIAHSRKGEEPVTQNYLRRSYSSVEQYETFLSTSAIDDNQNRKHSSCYGPSRYAILHNIGHSHWRCGNYDNAVTAYEEALGLLSSRHQTDYALEIASTINCIAVTKFYAKADGEGEGEKVASNYDDILQMLTDALTLRLSASDPSTFSCDRETATIINNSGFIRLCQGEFSLALLVFQEAREHRIQTLGEKHMDVAASIFNIAQAKEYLGFTSEAIDLYKEYLNIILLHTTEGSKQVAEVLFSIGHLSYRNKDLDQSQEYLSRALAASRCAFGASSHTVASIMNKMGCVLHDQNNLDLALEAYESGLAMERTLHPPLHENISLALLNIGRVHRRQEKWDKAIDSYREAMFITRCNNDPTSIANIISDVSFINYQVKGDYDFAVKLISEAMICFDGKIRGDDYLRAFTLNTLGLVQTKGGFLNLATTSFLEAIKIFKSLKRTEVHEFASVCINAADLHKKIGKSDKALELYQEALNFEESKSLYDDSEMNVDVPLCDNNKAFICCQIGQLLAAREEFGEALRYLEMSSKICLDNLTTIDPACTSEVLTSLGNLYLIMGDGEKAKYTHASAIQKFLCITNPPGAAAA